MAKVIGSQKLAALAREEMDVYDLRFNYIDSDLGGYGLYYRSVIAELGLIYRGGRGLPTPVDLPSERGKEVAAHFRSAIQTTSYYRDHFADSEEAPIGDLREYAASGCLCQLQTRDAPDRTEMRDVFLHGGDDNDALARRETLRFLLDLAKQTEGHALAQDAFRQLIYLGNEAQGASYRASDDLVSTHKRWRLYQAREHYGFALNALFFHLCDWGLDAGGATDPVSLARIRGHFNGPTGLDFDRLAARLSVAAPGLTDASAWDDLVEWLRSLVGGGPADFDGRCDSRAPVNEHILYWLTGDAIDDPAVMVAGMITILALLEARFGDPELWLSAEWQISRAGGGGRLSLDGFLRDLRARRRRGAATLGEVVDWLLESYVINQHQLVAASKLPDNTFRFTREAGGLRFFDLKNELDFQDSRFDALATFVHELGFCGDLREPSHGLTADGLTLLQRGDLV
jgi:hypothetical protein